MRKIAVVTGSRSEYGLLMGLMHELKTASDVTLQVLVTGMHLEDHFGLTYKEIEKDGFTIAAKVPVLESDDSPAAMARAVARGISGFTEVYQKLSPDLVVVLGDRFEILAAAESAMLLSIPVAHIHGGETTEGAIDESIRHAITKMSQLHFTTADVHRKRVIQLGENPLNVYNVGAPGLDNLASLKLLSLVELENALNFKSGKQLFLVTFHPETLSETPIKQQMGELFSALRKFPEAKIIFTKPNADSGGREIASQIDSFVQTDPQKYFAFVSLGQLKYLSLMKAADVVIGNSSSGLIEAPFFKKPTVNIGDRQKGRLCGDSVIHTPTKSDSIETAIKRAISAEIQTVLSTCESPYGKPGAAKKMAAVLRSADLSSLKRKRFFDL
jgi:GDP/UDP-N,N'-diacetylbacillosamine 2-epimerase (hydrolysing)